MPSTIDLEQQAPVATKSVQSSSLHRRQDARPVNANSCTCGHETVQFLQYGPARREEWDQFVLSNPQAGFDHLSAQILLTEEDPRKTNRSIMMYQGPGRLVGVLPLYEVRSLWLRTIKIRTLSSDAGPLFRPDMSDCKRKRSLDLLIGHVKSLGNQLGVDRISISYPSFIEEQLAIEHFGFFPLRRYDFTENNLIETYLDLRCNEADLLASLERQHRQKVRMAERTGVQISAIESREDWLDCETLNEQTLGKLKHSKRMMEIVWDEFIAKGHAYALIAREENSVLSVVVVLTFHKCAYYWIAYNARPLPTNGANHYLIWQSILHAKKLGMSFFLMGKYFFHHEDLEWQGISDFKSRFGGTPYYVLGGTLVLKREKHYFILFFTKIIRYLKFLWKQVTSSR